ncbi:malate synthase G [Paraglaciecola hydrolytica]|uniref:Malate synthase G n=1 Tax=Paraglaciecola hydrolytica TaxID=1799789 RepID=A0A135ZZU7_9ALTE|nr:malate synthase G [Paraglaciecola hydrolytica]KXI28529.1 malate synthase G [Paraglaciecola hydrolytica]
MNNYIQHGNLQIAAQLHTFLTQQVLPDSGLVESDFWIGFEKLLFDLTPVNQALLQKRNELQQQINNFCINHKSASAQQYKSFLKEIGYLLPEPADFTITTANVDPEIATMAGPQLVVPINNARFALNAANARWGSLYDAVYGSDIIAETEGKFKGPGFNPIRGKAVVSYVRNWLDSLLPLESGSHQTSVAYAINTGELLVTLADGATTRLQNPSQLVGFNGKQQQATSMLFTHHGLHVELLFDIDSPNASGDPATLKDVILEAALTTIMDCEDSVAAVDAEDKTLVYQNWLGLIKGDLTAEVQQGSKLVKRQLNPNREYQDFRGSSFSLNSRSLMFIRNVGHLMTSDAILCQGEPIPEGIMDAVITSLIAKHDLLNHGQYKNSLTGSIYIVKPKMHGPEEVAFTDTLFARVEQLLALPPNTIKMGIMDEERRTSLNLRACIHAAKARVVFINTGFLDRTGDEIHTSMLLGAFAPKAEIKTRAWLSAYEKLNVINGIQTGMSGKAQIGKGMWPVPDQMANMMQAKLGHVQSGANTAWVPSPTAATLHALHYHQLDVFSQRQQLSLFNSGMLDDMLQVPLLTADHKLTPDNIQDELDNNVQGILGYVVRWINQGIGCSKVPDINNVGLMEDRATLRISSQHIANWLEHNIVSAKQVDKSLLKMAKLVDEQNCSDPDYISMTSNTQDSIAFQAAHQLIFKGKEQANGYTEPVLHTRRREFKQTHRKSSKSQTQLS